MNTLSFLGHACFKLSNANTTIIFDPFLTDNPFNIAKADEVAADYILVSHGHFDHIGDTISIAKRTEATVISTSEIAKLCANNDCKSHGMHLGGKRTFDFGYIRIAPAFHGAGIPGGHACGFIVNFFGTVIYFAGDTALFSDMALLGRLEKIDYALVPIGDNFTMGPDDAVEAVDLLKPKNVIPMHYNTWPIIEQSPESFKNLVESKLNIPVIILQPGHSCQLE